MDIFYSILRGESGGATDYYRIRHVCQYNIDFLIVEFFISKSPSPTPPPPLPYTPLYVYTAIRQSKTKKGDFFFKMTTWPMTYMSLLVIWLWSWHSFKYNYCVEGGGGGIRHYKCKTYSLTNMFFLSYFILVSVTYIKRIHTVDQRNMLLSHFFASLYIKRIHMVDQRNMLLSHFFASLFTTMGRGGGGEGGESQG
jgi:hypothetical protein